VSFYHCSGYYATDPYCGRCRWCTSRARAFDYGTLGILPTLGMSADKLTETGRMAKLDKASEQTLPGYYTVKLEGGIQIEATASRRAATFRVGFPEQGTPVLMLLDHRLEGEITQADYALSARISTARPSRREHVGGSDRGYDLFARGVVDVAPKSVGGFDASALHPGQAKGNGVPLGAWLELPAGTRTVTLRLAVSFVDGDGAKKNLDAEAPSFDFEACGQRPSGLEEGNRSGRDLRLERIRHDADGHGHLSRAPDADLDERRRRPLRDVFGKTASGNASAQRLLALGYYRTLHPGSCSRRTSATRTSPRPW